MKTAIFLIILASLCFVASAYRPTGCKNVTCRNCTRLPTARCKVVLCKARYSVTFKNGRGPTYDVTRFCSIPTRTPRPRPTRRPRPTARPRPTPRPRPTRRPRPTLPTIKPICLFRCLRNPCDKKCARFPNAYCVQKPCSCEAKYLFRGFDVTKLCNSTLALLTTSVRVNDDDIMSKSHGGVISNADVTSESVDYVSSENEADVMSESDDVTSENEADVMSESIDEDSENEADVMSESIDEDSENEADVMSESIDEDSENEADVMSESIDEDSENEADVISESVDEDSENEADVMSESVDEDSENEAGFISKNDEVIHRADMMNNGLDFEELLHERLDEKK